METVLQGLPGVFVYLDDILITGASEKELLEHLKLVLQRLEDVGLWLKRSKCQFMVSHVEYLGHRIDQGGLHPTAGKVEVIQKAPAPTNKTQLKAFLGLINYYCKFLPHLSFRLSLLYLLFRKNSRWCWTKAQENAFQAVKSGLSSDLLLVHLTQTKRLF